MNWLPLVALFRHLLDPSTTRRHVGIRSNHSLPAALHAEAFPSIPATLTDQYNSITLEALPSRITCWRRPRTLGNKSSLTWYHSMKFNHLMALYRINLILERKIHTILKILKILKILNIIFHSFHYFRMSKKNWLNESDRL